MNKFTKGPWIVEDDGIVSIADKDGDWPSIVTQSPHSIVKENWIANARLIAAAPCMYNALKQFMNPNISDLEAQELIRKAIRKAEGI